MAAPITMVLSTAFKAFWALPSMAAPITMVLSTAFKAFWAVTPGKGLMYRSEFQSIPLRKGYDASDSFFAAALMASPLGALAPPEALDTWLDFTTSLNSRNAE